jgi:DNA-binding transcriptional ArsR family regulator
VVLAWLAALKVLNDGIGNFTGRVFHRDVFSGHLHQGAGRDLRDITPPLWQNMRMNADNAACSLSADSQYVELAVEIFAMLADATRVRIILALRDGEMAVGALADVVGKSPAAVSQHLAKMRLARMVSTRQDGTRVLYRLENEHARQLVVDAVFQAEHALGGEPAHHRRDRKAAS